MRIQKLLSLFTLVFGLCLAGPSASLAQETTPTPVRPIDKVLTAILNEVPSTYNHKNCMIAAFKKVQFKATELVEEAKTEAWADAEAALKRFVDPERSEWEAKVIQIFKGELNYQDFLPAE